MISGWLKNDPQNQTGLVRVQAFGTEKEDEVYETIQTNDWIDSWQIRHKDKIGKKKLCHKEHP